MRKLVLPVLFAVALAAAPSTGGEPPEPTRPNVLIVIVDDQRAGEGTLAVMPKTRKFLMERGTRFTRAFSTTPLCCPARASLFTGRYAHNHGVYTNLGKLEFDHRGTIQDRLNDAGYNTGIAGKLFNNWPVKKDPPHFDKWAVYPGGFFNATYNVNGTQKTISRYSTKFLQNKSVDFLNQFENTDDRPWFLYVAPYAPHAPFTPAAKYQRAEVPYWRGNPAVFEKDRSDKPDYVLLRDETYKTWRKNRRLQLRTLMSVDDLVGRLRNRLFDLNEARNTLVIYLSDNGYMWADHGLYDKGAPYSPSIRIPFLMRYPAGPTLPQNDGRLVANIDIAPTILDAAGLAPGSSRPIDGTSLFDEGWDRTRILTEYRNNDNRWTPPTWASTRTKNWQYTEYYNKNGKRIDREYYDVREDPWQLRNLLKDGDGSNDPDGLKQMSETLVEDRTCSGLECP